MQLESRGSTFFSPLRYPGGKGKMAPYVKSLLSVNGLEDCHYVEPYAGGAAVALELLFHEYAKTIHINDIDPGVAAFWRSVLSSADELCKKIRDAKLSIPEWKRQRLAASNYELDDISLGFATFFMNRTNRSGILRAGVIGGLAQSGDWTLDARFNKTALISRIEKIASLANRIRFTQLDAKELLVQIPNEKTTFVYLDPPYFAKGKDLYTHYYEDSDHVTIARTTSKLNRANWIVSYDAVDRIHELYGKFRCIHYSLSYSAQQRYKGGEVMYFSPKLKIPEFAGAMHLFELSAAA
jgi:DNA adenine methylase